MSDVPNTVVEVAPFTARAREIWTDDELQEFVDFIARNPLAGVVIPGSGGIRKVRWAASGRGKRGGARIIYYFHSEALPLFLLTVYGKNVADDLSARQKQTLAAAVAELVARYRRV
jgi:mRNA-degrading endonuclease RelE of RelBE toxin-antitoxin system